MLSNQKRDCQRYEVRKCPVEVTTLEMSRDELATEAVRVRGLTTLIFLTTTVGVTEETVEVSLVTTGVVDLTFGVVMVAITLGVDVTTFLTREIDSSVLLRSSFVNVIQPYDSPSETEVSRFPTLDATLGTDDTVFPTDVNTDAVRFPLSTKADFASLLYISARYL